jgi:methionyl aminopeptidase
MARTLIGGLPRRSPDELKLMRRAGRVVAEMHADVRTALRPGVSTAQLDHVAREVLSRRGAQSNFLGYHGYPAVICASVNDVVVHGIPSPDVVIAEGDLVSIDCGAIVDGWHADAAFSVVVGEGTPLARRLVAVTDDALAAAIAACRPGGSVSDLGAAVEAVVIAAGYDVLHGYSGHGIGRAMHERPDVPNIGPPGRGPKLAAGVTLAIEPMVVAGRGEGVTDDDDWTVRTADGTWASHSEHTVLISDHGAEILTML